MHLTCHKVSAHDAQYVVLAQALRATLVTADARPAKAADAFWAVSPL